MSDTNDVAQPITEAKHKQKYKVREVECLHLNKPIPFKVCRSLYGRKKCLTVDCCPYHHIAPVKNEKAHELSSINILLGLACIIKMTAELFYSTLMETIKDGHVNGNNKRDDNPA